MPPESYIRRSIPDIAIAHGAAVISGRSLVNDRATCPNAAFPDKEIQERVPETETIRTLRLSLNLLGDGFVEAIGDQTLIELSKQQCKSSHGKICGQILYVPIVEAPGQMGVGRFGWKDQHASLLSFAGDAYLNEMGITNRLQPNEVTNLCSSGPEPNDPTEPDGDFLWLLTWCWRHHKERCHALVLQIAASPAVDLSKEPG
jgi:Di-haem oxidoreductase, putative peroxidase